MALLFALVAGPLAGLGPALAAQDTTQAHRDTSQRAPDTTAAPAAPAAPTPLGAPAQVPATHVVTKGETLWSIAQLYYSDPLLWPDIYRLNTALIDDPHWIYPGEELNLQQVVSVAQAPPESAAVQAPQGAPTGGPADTVHAAAPADTVTKVAVAPPDTTTVLDTAQAVIEAPPPPPAGPLEAYQTVFDRRLTATQQVRDVLKAYINQPYRPVRRGEFYSAGFLTENESFPWGEVVGNTEAPAIPEFVERPGAFIYQEIAIAPPRRASYHVGDSLLIVRLDRHISGWGDVVVPHGIARVTEVQRQQVLARVVMQFGRILGSGLRSVPLEPFRDPGAVRPTPVRYGLEGVVVAVRDPHVLTIEQQVIFISRGRAEGVTVGDVFEVYRPAMGVIGTASEEPALVVEIVHTREHSASGLVLNRIQHPDLAPGLPARLIRKMPS